MLEGADVRLIRHADGRANWQGIGGEVTTPANPDAEPMELRIEGIAIKDSRVLFVDEAVPRRVEITALNFATDGIAPGEPFTDTSMSGVLHLDGFVATSMSGVLHLDGFVAAGVPFKLEIPRAVLPKDLGAVQVGEFTLGFGSFEASGAVQGTLGEMPRLKGKLESNSFDPRALLTSTGISAPKTTDADALGELQFAATWSYDAGAMVVDPFTLTLDDSHFTGNFRRGAGENPVGEFALQGDQLAIARYLPPPDPASEPFVLPTAQLKALQFRGTISLEQATLDDISMKGVILRLLLDEQGLRQEPKP
jgi:hypothetical protein